MKSKGLFDKTMHFLVHNSFMVTVSVMCFVHATLLVIFCFSDVPPLINFNILSVVVYLFCIILCKFGHILPVYISLFLEVAAYTIISIYYIGWKCGSCCFLCSIFPIIIYFGCMIFKGTKRWIIIVLLIVNFSLYVALYLIFNDAQPIYDVSVTTTNILIIFSSFAMIFSVIYYNAMYIYASESEKTNLEEKNQKLSLDAHEDALTGLLNRRGFLPLMGEVMSDSKTNHFCVAFCDLDNFKRINDNYGHDCGDEVLRHISKIIKNEMTGCNICRWGGEEIIILMRDYDFAVAKEKMEYIRKYIENNPTVFYNKRINATITIGIEENKEKYNVPEDIIKIADARMYYGKQNGKNIVIYEDN